MTYPPQGGQWQPNDPNQVPQQPSVPFPAQQPGGYPQQGYPQQQPQGYPQQGGYPQPGYGAPQGGAGFPPPKKSKTGLIVGVFVAVIAIAAAAVVYFVAFNKSDTPAASQGSSTPTDAAANLLSAVNKGDVAGLLVALPPAENALMQDANKQFAEELKRLDIYKKDANPNDITGLKAEGLKFDDAKKQKINDKLEIQMLVEGKITINSDMRDLPFNDKFIEQAFPNGIDSGAKTQTIDIAKEVQRNKGEPIRIATIKVDGKWYPSLFYSIADNALHAAKKQWPSKSIPANGAGSAAEAVKQFVDAAVNADIEKLIELTPPDEMGALHDAGPALLDAIGGKATPTGVKINKLETDSNSVTGGTKVTVKELDLTAEGTQFRLVRQGDCYEATAQGRTQKMCAKELAGQLGQTGIPPAAATAATHVVEGVFKSGVGLVATEVGGKWYVSPGRSFFEVFLSIVRGLQPGDIEGLIKAFGKK